MATLDMTRTLKAHLLTVTEITDIVGVRITGFFLPQSRANSAQVPAIVIREIGSIHEGYLLGALGFGHFQAWVDCYTRSEDQNTLATLAELVRQNIQGLVQFDVDLGGGETQRIDYAEKRTTIKDFVNNASARDPELVRNRQLFEIHAPEPVIYG